MGPIRQSLSNQRTGRTTGTRRIRGRIQGKANAIQKEIGNYRIITQNSLSLLRLYHRIALRYFDRRARVRPGCGFSFSVVRITRPDLLGQFRPILAHIIVHIQVAIKAGFQLVFGHRQRVQFDA